MIERVEFQNFKSLQDVTIQLGRLTALVGPNGCGKSSVLQGTKLALDRPRAYRGDHLEPVQPQRLSYRGNAEKTNVIATLTNAARFGFIWRVVGQSRGEEAVHSSGPLPKAAHLRLDVVEMTRTSLASVEQPVMAPNGAELASALAWMKGAEEDEFAAMTMQLREIVPGVKRIKALRERTMQSRMDKVELDGQSLWRTAQESAIGDQFSIEFEDGSEIPSDLLSEGTVLVLGLLAKLHERGRPDVLLIDDIDRGLHLSAQVKLIEALRTMLERDPTLQIVCTTHSPYLLDLFKPEEVRVLALDAERRTHARPLTEHPEFGKWKFGTQTGELWATLGEDWVVAGNAG